MHIQFSKVRYKNILSVGNYFIEIDFQDTKTTLISAPNGHGKSLMLDAIVFALFGKPFRKINKTQLPNSINQKEMVVEIQFNIGGHNYMIRRGIKPAIFEIWKNDELLNKDAASRDYQEYLEQSILKMSYKAFTQIVILGSATYVPFMELPAAQRREIIEDLLDIQVFSTMNLLLKDRLAINKERIGENNHSIELIKTRIDSARDHNAEIQRMKLMEVDKLKSRATELMTAVDVCKAAISDHESHADELKSTILDAEKQRNMLDKIRSLERELRLKQKTLEKEIDFYSNHDNCPTCKQGIAHEFKSDVLVEKRNKEQEIQDGLSKLADKQAEIESRIAEISQIEAEIAKFNSLANDQRLTLKMTMNQLKSIKNELQKAEQAAEEIDQGKIRELVTDLTTLQGTQTELYEQRETLGVVATMLKDGGIKTSIIRTYIPIMNKIINQYLSEFELFVDFNLDENFNETIKSRFRDAFSFASFSEGEKMRISLSIIFAWRALAKLRNSVSTNLLIMDETIDGAADSAGVESLIDILKKLNPTDNVFVISHRGEQFAEKFDRHIRFEKIKNFTQLVS
jgi:DNA repair exonuclease SbcCD ATPase subunit